MIILSINSVNKLGNAGGRYIATDNVLYYKVFNDKNVERHVNLHELFNWNDAQEYINSGHVIKYDQDVIDYMC